VAGDVLTSNGAGSLPSFKKPKILQMVYVDLATGDSTTTVIPGDTSIPTSTEGKECLTRVITPISATSQLYVEAGAVLSSDNARYVLGITLFLDSETSARAVAVNANYAADSFLNVSMQYMMPSPGTSPLTFRLRYGTTSGTCYLNRNSSINPIWGSTPKTYIKITEYEP